MRYLLSPMRNASFCLDALPDPRLPLAVVKLIGTTKTKTGLKVESALDTRSYKKGIKISKAEMKRLDITGDQFHPEWNYTIRPRQPSKS